MRVSTLSTAFVALVASAVTAAPVASNEGEVLQARNAEGEIEARSSDIGLYFCKAFGFTGGCLYQRWQYNVCYNVPDGWNDVISSVGPDAGEGGCYFFPAYNCATVSSPSGSLYVTNPGYSELSGGVGLWNDVISSFICY